MIQSLIIQNFAIIESCSIDFERGMTVLTGQTGAGKSIIIDAIGQLLGDRSQTSMIRNGQEKAFIEGVFDISNNQEIIGILKDVDFDVEDALVVSKSISIDGKSIIKLNYRTVSLGLLKTIMPKLVDIHSQFETHSLFNPKNHIHLLDDYIQTPMLTLKQEYSNIYKQYKTLLKQKKSLLEEEYSDEQIDFYQAQLDEIKKIDLESIEEDHLYNQKKKIEASFKLKESFDSYQEIMDNQVLNSLKEALSYLDCVDEDPDYSDEYTKIYDYYYSLKESHHNIMNTYSSSEYEYEDLETIQNTLLSLNRLKKKYGYSIESIIESRDDLSNKIEFALKRDTILLNISAQEKDLYQQLSQIAQNMSDLRKKHALTLQTEIEKLLKELHLPNVIFLVDFKEVEATSLGIDHVTFLIQTNVGSQIQQLHKIASGGELSRIMLALKLQTLKYTSTSTIIFDEADSGVSGLVAQSIGSVMKRISKQYQVLCITHLFQVAAYNDHHYFISKDSDETSTHVYVESLNEQRSNEELAKMISGKDITNESLEHVKQIKNNLT